MIAYEKCLCCGSAAAISDTVTNGVKHQVCGCGAIFGVLTKAEQSRLVKSDWAETEPNAGDMGYFDFTTPDGKDRFHGWYDKRTGKIVQVG